MEKISFVSVERGVSMDCRVKPGNDEVVGMAPPMPQVSAVKPAVTVIIPTFNEAESIGAVVAALPRDIVDRVIVADGGSSDGTPDRAQAAGAQVIAVGRGYGLACLAGAQAAEDADILVYMDGDGADDPAAIAALIAPIAQGTCDFVISLPGASSAP
jgi:glycosyltransferase involved in cell wall biosynthesis